MTDRDTIRAMLTRAGLKYAERERIDGRDGPSYDAIVVEDKGYDGFLSEFWFDKTSGALKHMAAWE